MDLEKILEKVWEVPEANRTECLNLTDKIFDKIIQQPKETKFRNMNLIKLKERFRDCPSCFDLLYAAGFKKDGTVLFFFPLFFWSVFLCICWLLCSF